MPSATSGGRQSRCTQRAAVQPNPRTARRERCRWQHRSTLLLAIRRATDARRKPRHVGAPLDAQKLLLLMSLHLTPPIAGSPIDVAESVTARRRQVAANDRHNSYPFGLAERLPRQAWWVEGICWDTACE